METLNFQSKYKWKISNLYFWKSNEFSGQVKFFWKSNSKMDKERNNLYLYGKAKNLYGKGQHLYQMKKCRIHVNIRILI